MRLINIGFGNIVFANRLIAIVSPESAPVKRLVQDARDRGMLIDATYGRRTRAVLITDSDHVILSAVQPETVANRLNAQDSDAGLGSDLDAGAGEGDAGEGDADEGGAGERDGDSGDVDTYGDADTVPARQKKPLAKPLAKPPVKPPAKPVAKPAAVKPAAVKPAVKPDAKPGDKKNDASGRKGKS